MTIVEAIEQVASRRGLREGDAHSVMALIMAGEATPAQIAGLLMALRMKGETGAEITGFARAMREHVVPIRSVHSNLVDTCGTGGDAIKTFNLSTAAAIIASAAGAPVAKHGNRAITSKCGSADVLEAAGVNLLLSPQQATTLLNEIGITFLFAPNYHPAMKHAAGPRKEMKLRTVFNILGPLTNPAGAERQLIGVFSPALVPKMAFALRRLGCKRGIVAHGMIGLDEISPIGATKMAIIDGTRVSERTMQAEEFGIRTPELSEITCPDGVSDSLAKLKTAISDAESPEARAALPSAGAAIWLAELADSIEEGVQLARKAIAAGNAQKKLADLVWFSNSEPKK